VEGEETKRWGAAFYWTQSVALNNSLFTPEQTPVENVLLINQSIHQEASAFRFVASYDVVASYDAGWRLPLRDGFFGVHVEKKRVATRLIAPPPESTVLRRTCVPCISQHARRQSLPKLPRQRHGPAPRACNSVKGLEQRQGPGHGRSTLPLYVRNTRRGFFFVYHRPKPPVRHPYSTDFEVVEKQYLQ